jgi:fucose permease
MATKTSILIFYLRLSRNTKKLLRIASYVTLAVVNIAGLVLTFLNLFQCTPITALFGSSDGQCIALVTLYLASAPVNVITDLAILVLPIPVLTGMRLPQKQKTVLVVTFCLGIFVTVVDVIRIFYLQQALIDGFVPSNAPKIGDQADFAWYASLSLMWSAVEVNIGIICACIPTLKPLATRILPKLIFDHSQGSSKSESSERPAGGTRSTESTHDVPSSPEKLIHPLPPREDRGQEQNMGTTDFLTTPGMDPQEIQRAHPTLTQTSHATESTVHFGFVNMRQPKSMLKTRGAESFKYCTLVTVLFFLWGFSYGLLNELNSQISALSDSNTQGQILGLQAAYFGAYLFGPPTVGLYVLKRGGFKACFITGLCIYGTGTLMFWPSAVLTSFAGFIVSNFVVSFGLSILETAANPFIALCGPLRYAEMRLLLAQGVQAIGSVVSPVLAQKALFVRIKDRPSLIDVQWTYLAIALLCVILALFFYYMPLPEASDEDLYFQCQPSIQDSAEISPVLYFNRYQITSITLFLGVGSQFFYVGAQECHSVFAEQLITSLAPATSSITLTPFSYVVVGRTVFAISRFLAAALCLIFKPRYLLLFTYSSALLFSVFIITIPSFGNPNIAAGMAIALSFFEGPLWPIIFAISLRHLGRRTKTGAACLAAAASGGAAFPWVMYAVQSIPPGQTVQYSFCVVVALLAAGLLFPIYLEIVPAAKAQVDLSGNETRLLRSSDSYRHSRQGERVETPTRRLNQRFSGFMSKMKNSTEGDLPITEHRERQQLGRSLKRGVSP